MTHEDEVLFLALFGLIAAYLIVAMTIGNAWTNRLERVHPETFRDLDEPGIFHHPIHKVLPFLLLRRHRRLGDSKLSVLSDAYLAAHCGGAALSFFSALAFW